MSDANPEDGPAPGRRLEDYAFDLPEELIAQEPAARRDGSRLMLVDRAGSGSAHRRFEDLPDLLDPGDLLVLNVTRVVPARLRGRRAATGGAVEALIHDRGPEGRLEALLKARGRLVPGEVLELAGGALRVELVAAGERGSWSMRLIEGDPDRAMESHGVMPLPPYVRRARDRDPRDPLDRERYQTVYADAPGAVAAPTAGLHFTQAVFERLAARGIDVARLVLHVGVGTFRPVEVSDLREHRMHEERYDIPESCSRAVAEARARGGRVIAVGTTSLRAMESAWDEGLGAPSPGAGATRLFLRPPMRPRSAEGLLTNFHLPQSTLLMLVSCLLGRERVLEAYAEAIEHRYRFFSYGDAMLIR